MTRKRGIYIMGIASVSLVSGCTVGPDYHRPRIDAPVAFAEAPTTQPATQPTAVDIARWWEVFGDQELSSLTERAIESNLDLKLAAARVLEARAVLGVSRSDLFPSIDGKAGYQHDRRSQNADGVNQGGSISGRAFDPDSHNWSAGFDASWEIDVFGGIRRGIESSWASFQASIEDHRDVLVTLVSDVARNYIELRGAQRQLEIVRKNLATQDQTLELTRSRFRAGLTSDLDVARAEAQAMTTRAQIPPLEDQIHRSIRRLSVLLGEQPETLTNELMPVAGIPMPQPAVVTGLPTELLRRRPDVRRAERQLAAATARIGVATADLFPRFSLTGDFGLQAGKGEDLFEEKSIGWSIGPAMRWQLLNFGRVRSNIEAEQARTEQQLRFYEQTVLLALEEAENTIGSYRREQIRRESLFAAVQSSQRAVDLADQLYRQGLTAFQDVLDAQRRLLEAESQLVTSQQTVSTNLVALYKAMGGGWDPQEPPVDAGPVIKLP